MSPISTLPVRRVEALPPGDAPEVTRADAWMLRIPAVDRLLRRGLDLGRVTVLVGENGSGKSTIVEAVAMAYGLGAEGGSVHARHTTAVSESSLHARVRLVRGVSGGRWGYFLRAETMHGLYTYLRDIGPPPRDRNDRSARLHELSHGESFLEVLRTRFTRPGLYVLDEPEAALSFRTSLAALAHLTELAADGGQLLIATHSPVLAALPGARILELDEGGWTERAWDELALVREQQGFLADPERFLRHLRHP